MKVDLGFIVSIGTSIVLVAATWGALQAKVRFLCQRMDDLKDEKASSEKINSIFEKIANLEVRLIEKIETLEERLHELKEDVAKKN